MISVVTRKHFVRVGLSACCAVVLSGCMYRFTSSVPENLRTIAVPVFENNSGFPEIDAIATQYTLREIQREGTFQIRSVDSAALKVLGRVLKSDLYPIAYDRNYEGRANEYRYTLTVEVTLVERSTGKVLINAVPISANTTFLARDDMLTGAQDAYYRLSKEVGRSIVDMLLGYWAE